MSTLMCEKSCRGIGICQGWRRTWQWTFDCWQYRQSRVQAAASAAKPRQTYFEDNNTRRESAGVGNVVDGKKNFFAERDGDYWAKLAHGGIAEEVVLPFLAGTDFER